MKLGVDVGGGMGGCEGRMGCRVWTRQFAFVNV